MTAISEELSDEMETAVRALHEALGGDGWAYTNYGGDELRSQRDRLVAGVSAVAASLRSGNGGEVRDDVDPNSWEGAFARLSTPPVGAETGEPPFEFDRYVNGQLMAEGVTVERQPTLEKAMQVAARIAAKGPNGETPVLIFASPQPPTLAGVREITDEMVEAAREAYRNSFLSGPNAPMKDAISAALAAAKGGWGMSRKTKPLPSPLTEKFIAEREAREEAGE